MIAGLTFKQILIIIGIMAPILTGQTIVLNSMAKDREVNNKTERAKEIKTFKKEIVNEFRVCIADINNVYTLSELIDAVSEITTESEKSGKNYTDRENRKQDTTYATALSEKVLVEFFNEAYIFDSNDSTFRVVYYRDKENNVVILKLIPVLNSVYDDVNYTP